MEKGTGSQTKESLIQAAVPALVQAAGFSGVDVLRLGFCVPVTDLEVLR